MGVLEKTAQWLRVCSASKPEYLSSAPCTRLKKKKKAGRGPAWDCSSNAMREETGGSQGFASCQPEAGERPCLKRVGGE